MAETLDVLAFVLTLVVGSLLLVYGAVLMSAAFTRVRRKGYRSFGANVAGLGGLCAGLGFSITVMVKEPWLWTNSVLLFSLFVVTSFACVATTFAIAWILPRRSNRLFGPRRVGIPFKVIGWGITLGCGVPFAIVFLLGMWSSATTVTERLRLVLVTAGLFAFFAFPGQAFVRRGKQIEGQPTLEDILAKDTRPPVLYMRPFEREREVFVSGPKDRYRVFKTRVTYLDTTKNPIVHIPFEEYVAGAVTRVLGPFVALGSPEDYLSPIGAVRKYAKDDNWKEEFDFLGRAAAAILVQVGNSQNLKWEFEHIREKGWQERLFIVTRHPSNSPTGMSRQISDWFDRLKGFTPVSWSGFAGSLATLGYDLGSDDPGPGAIVTFDTNGRRVVLTTGADLPREYVEPIAARVEQTSNRHAAAHRPDPSRT